MISLKAERIFKRIFLVSSGSALTYGILRDDDLDEVPSHEKIKYTELGERCSFTKRHKGILESGKPIVFDNVLTKEETFNGTPSGYGKIKMYGGQPARRQRSHGYGNLGGPKQR